MNKNQLVNNITDHFTNENFKFSVIVGLLIILCYVAFGVSLVLLFFYNWWWKLSIASVGLFTLIKKIIDIKLHNWLNKKNK